MSDTEKSTPAGRIHSLPISRLFPNMVTLIALCAGLSSMRFALLHKWELAVTFIIIAAFIDGLDGRIARLLKATSPFGAHLDSLVDFVNFGVAPAFILYVWQLEAIEIRGLGWGCVQFFCICCAIRLARFNTNLEDEDRPVWADKFFTGIPSPAGGLLALAPMMVSFKFGTVVIPPVFLGLYVVITGLLMASRIPMFSGKKIQIAREYVSLTLMAAGLLIVALILEPWMTLPALGILYLCSIPVSSFMFYRLKHAAALHSPHS